MRELLRSLSESYRVDLLDAIERAKQGQLPPAAQEYCLEEIAATKGTEEYPRDGDKLLNELRCTLAEHGQMNDREQAEHELAAVDTDLLFYVSLDRFTFAEITHIRKQDKYDGRIYINFEKHCTDLQKCLQTMRSALTAWLAESEISYKPDTVHIAPADYADSQFGTLQEAIALIDGVLQRPESIR